MANSVVARTLNIRRKAALLCGSAWLAVNVAAQTVPLLPGASGAQGAQGAPAAQPPAPLLLTPVAPGTVQQRPPLATKLPTQPQLWTFAELKGDADSPTSARLQWLGRQGATSYRLYRDNLRIAELAAGAATSNSYADSALSPGQTYSYFVEAVQVTQGSKQRTVPTLATGGLKTVPIAGAAGEQLLETSQRKGVVTPPVEAPRDFNATISDAQRRNVRLTWTAPKWATAVQILRDGAVLATATAAQAPRFEDAAVAAGSHRYALRTLYAGAPDKPAHASAPSNELQLRLGPFRIVAFGDSIMWGQGLAEPAKFSALTRDALRAALGVEIELVSFAHSGAKLRASGGALPALEQAEPTGFDQARLSTHGEVPNTFPSIAHQINVLAQARAAALSAAEVELVLVDGCINDVGVMSILNPTVTPAQVSAAAQTQCSAMASVLQRVHELFPSAAIVVTGYYPIVSMQSDLTAVSVLVSSAVGTAALAAPLVGIPLDPVTAVAAAPIAMPSLKQSVANNSAAFASASNAALASAVQSINARSGKAGLASFAPVSFQSANAYAAPDSWLWLVPTGLIAGDQDDVKAQRTATCAAPGVIDTSEGAPFVVPQAGALALAAGKCPNASMGHPNRKGAMAYAAAISAALQPQLQRWRQRYAAMQP